MKLDLRRFAAALALHLSMNANAESSLDVHRVGNEVEVAALATLDADPRIVWGTLVDYDRLPEFIPDLPASRTLSRAGDDAVVEQSGLAGLGPFKFRIGLTLSIREVPMASISAHAVAGDFARFMTVYRMHALPDGRTELDYQAAIEPKGGIPPMIGVPVMRRAIQKQFDALLAEIERRARAARATKSATGVGPLLQLAYGPEADNRRPFPCVQRYVSAFAAAAELQREPGLARSG